MREHETATAHTDDGAWLIRCVCGRSTRWHGLLSGAVAEQTDHRKANNAAHARTLAVNARRRRLSQGAAA